jgi:uracil-DNA glycosylase
MRDKDQTASLIDLLAWYREMGVTEAVAERPTPWLQRSWTHEASAAPGEAPPLPSMPSRAVDLKPSGTARLPQRHPPLEAPDAVMAARAVARQARSLDELAAILAQFEGCTLKATAKNLCFYRGQPRARVMLIGEAPGREEDLAGKPFVGRAGQLLDKMLAAIGLGEERVHITNIVYWRPPGNRTPTPQEAQVCHPFLERQIELVAPELLVLLGGAAAKHVLGVSDGIMRLRGRLREVAVLNRTLKAVATLHPAYLLRTPAAKRLAWRDLLLIKASLAATANGQG